MKKLLFFLLIPIIRNNVAFQLRESCRQIDALTRSNTTLFLIIGIIASSIVFASDYNEQYKYMDELAVKAHTDKSSDHHNYTEIYARCFANMRERPLKFLEIGIYKGNSVKLWEDYFPNAELHFMDITLELAEYVSTRSHYHVANQESPQELHKFIEETGGDFDIIIDDGGHTMNQQITSFENLFPHVKSGGMYVIEDLHTSYWPQYGGNNRRRSSKRTAIEYTKTLIDELNFVGARTGRASHQNVDPSISNELNLYREKIESIHFYDSVVIIIKR